MSLTATDIDRYSRQIIIPDLGARGQARILDTRVAITGAEPGCQIALRYARATGFAASTMLEAVVDLVIAAEVNAVGEEERRRIARMARAVIWYSIEAGRLRSGLRRRGQPWPLIVECCAADPGLHAVGACDAVARAVAWTLGWGDVAEGSEVDLG